MFEPGEKVSIIGTFILSSIAEEGFLEFDPFERGQIEMNNEQNSSELIEVTASGKEKEFDGFNIGDFFVLSGTFEVERSNDVFTKIKVGDQLISVPNHKIMEVA